MVAIGGVRWREGPEARPLNVLLEEVINEFSDGSMDNETDDENDELELTKNSKEQRYGNLYGPRIPPTVLEARAALTDLQNLLRPPQKDGTGYKQPDFDPTFKGRLESMEKFLWKGKSKPADMVKGIYQQLNQPTNTQSIGKYVRAQDIVDYLKRPEIQARHGLKKTVSLATAQRWMFKLDYHWREEKKGQYVDGHERDDVVTYHQHVFLPIWKSFAHWLRNWREDDIMMEEGDPDDHVRSCRVIIWFHDESTFYAHDRQEVRWVHLTESAVPKPKGEGAL
ncbi:hypothetical protein F4604DRAFT_1933049 [Suillus subluteus]|nr:hypothetical protein F4604DRAFT_1933049 [Suillus subluteus]